MNPLIYKLASPLVLVLTLGNLAQAAAPKKAVPPHNEPTKSVAPATEKLTIAYLAQQRENLLPQAYFLPTAADAGLQGARLAITDDNTTGAFTRQQFELKEVLLGADGDPGAAFKQLRADGYRHILVDLPTDSVTALSALPEAADALLYNVSDSADDLRGPRCAANLLHLIPSRAMRADALAQYFAKKRWKMLFLAIGTTSKDTLYAAAIKRAVPRFGLKITEEKSWNHRFDERRTPESEVPVFSQGEEYDVMVVADEDGAFGDLLSYRTWSPRPVAGTQGLVATAWHPTLEQWGAIQLQNRFREQSKRWMTEIDYAAWLAIRAIGEAASRTKSLDFSKIKEYLLNDGFALAGFKGVPLSFRRWDGQLRQPMLLAGERSLVAVAPIDGFLHPKNELDTLGYDQPETQCKTTR
ncbi:MAG: branched-chain amino acid ABC transporter substrate-binding protein [Methylococcaceae bacterium]|nr:branched-chain amino acid ABC transporter substrate-binding protein [Methylococcaceae bacterium]